MSGRHVRVTGIDTAPLRQRTQLHDEEYSPVMTMTGSLDAPQLLATNTTPGSYFASPEVAPTLRERYAAQDAELARLVARRLKLGVFATQRARQELDQAIERQAELYEAQSRLLDRQQIAKWRARQPMMSDEELHRRIARYQQAKEYLHEVRTRAAFRDVRKFGILSAANDRMSEWYIGLSQRSRMAVAMGSMAMTAAASGAAAWSGEAFGPTTAIVGGAVLAGAKLYKVYGQARLGLYQEMAERLPETTGRPERKPPGRIARALGRVALATTATTKGWWGRLKQKLAPRVEPAESANAPPSVGNETLSVLSPSPSPAQLHGDAMSRMERRRQERIERAEKINRRAMIVTIGAGVLTAIGISSRFIDFGKFTDRFIGGPSFGATPSSSPPPITPTSPPSLETPPVTIPPSPAPPVEVPAPAPVAPPVAPSPTLPEYSLAAQTVEPGEGWYQTFTEMGITNPTEQANLLQRVGPELASHGWAYQMDGSYGISSAGTLSREALDTITNSRHGI